MVFALLAAVLHLCNVEMAPDPESEEVIVMNEDEIDFGKFCLFLEIKKLSRVSMYIKIH